MSESFILFDREIFVFGSNREGRHGKGAALTARQKYGAIYGQSSGLQGDSYAIITKELRRDFASVSLQEIRIGVQGLFEFARQHPQWRFNVSPIGCGLAGFKVSEIAPLFDGSPVNVVFTEEFMERISKEKSA